MEIKSSLQVLRDEGWAKTLFRGFSALTTFLFLFEYGEAFLGSLLLRVSVLFPNIEYFYFDLFGRIVAGLMGVAFIEWAMLQWRDRRLNHAQNENQSDIAERMDKRLGGAAWVMSCVYLVLSLIGYFFGNDPVFLDVTKWVGVLGVVTVIAAAAMNFIEDQAYERESPEFIRRLQDRQLQNRLKADAAARARRQLEAQRETLIQEGADHQTQRMVDDTRRTLTGSGENLPAPQTRHSPHGNDGNGVTHRVNPVNRGEDVEVAEPPRRVASEGSDTRPTVGRPGPL